MKTLYNRNLFLISTILLVLVLIVIIPNWHKKFYGFEFEDSFVNTAIALDDDIENTTYKFRTNPYNEIENGVPITTMSFTGHYIPYSVYLTLIKNIFN